MNRDLIEHIAVPKSRLSFGVLEEDREIGEGDIYGSYSADLIAMESRVRAPFRHGSHLWTCVSIRGGEPELEAYRLMPESMFTGREITTYSAKVRPDGGDAARSDPMGFYHGMSVQYGRASYVLTGPPALFVADPESEIATPDQLDLFGCGARP